MDELRADYIFFPKRGYYSLIYFAIIVIYESNERGGLKRRHQPFCLPHVAVQGVVGLEDLLSESPFWQKASSVRKPVLYRVTKKPALNTGVGTSRQAFLSFF